MSQRPCRPMWSCCWKLANKVRPAVVLRLNTPDCFLVYLCQNGTTFANTLAELTDRAGNECNPIFAFFDVDFSGEESNLARRKASRASWMDNGPPSPGSIHRTFTFSTQS